MMILSKKPTALVEKSIIKNDCTSMNVSYIAYCKSFNLSVLVEDNTTPSSDNPDVSGRCKWSSDYQTRNFHVAGSNLIRVICKRP